MVFAGVVSDEDMIESDVWESWWNREAADLTKGCPNSKQRATVRTGLKKSDYEESESQIQLPRTRVTQNQASDGTHHRTGVESGSV